MNAGGTFGLLPHQQMSMHTNEDNIFVLLNELPHGALCNNMPDWRRIKQVSMLESLLEFNINDQCLANDAQPLLAVARFKPHYNFSIRHGIENGSMLCLLTRESEAVAAHSPSSQTPSTRGSRPSVFYQSNSGIRSATAMAENPKRDAS